jgi:hypothetical protein
MTAYKVNRRIVMNGQEYNPGSKIDLTDAQADQMKNGQISVIPVEEAAVETSSRPRLSGLTLPSRAPFKGAAVAGSELTPVSTIEPIKPITEQAPTESATGSEAEAADKSAKVAAEIEEARVALDAAEAAVAEAEVDSGNESATPGTGTNAAPAE